ncbi:bifunctional metallophosphatase/5'-nucleotidase [Kineococcus indalonis]|uniref:bifunctional metallophosphatase/5'-nucleotidase n=1 Tax=Kineococcus indalonis TaxID=2696566 RepID=UPI001412B6E1|nr:5'-nucleotidase C-terminal domain-containing protein [Kineococcus indalonis]NAZ85090.1 bifunctional metallophosphatase/5'-nucleotidase [Kineococcus indalonis]
MHLPPTPGRRARRTGAALSAAALLTGLGATAGAGSAAAVPAPPSITLVSMTDVHGHVLDWDYFAGEPYPAGQGLGLARVSTIVDRVRAERGEASTLVVDDGDAIQGTPLTYYYARQEPVTATGVEHPMAQAYDAIGIDAQVVGNHEFNYGLDTLAKYRLDLDAPLLGANVLDQRTGTPYLRPWVLRDVKPTGGGRTVKVGVLGLTTPGSAVWDKQNVEGKLTFDDVVATAQREVPRMRAAGAEVVVVLSHSGRSGGSSYSEADLGPENVTDRVAAEVPGVDVVVAGHSHRDLPEAWIESTATPGKRVLVTQPYRWGASVTVTRLELAEERGRYSLSGADVQDVRAADAPEDPEVVEAVAEEHRKTVEYVDQVVATSTEELPATDSRWRDTPIIDFIQDVQTDTVREALAGTPDAELPVLSIAAPFSRTAVFPRGEVTVKDVAGLYVYDNTLQAVRMTGAQVRDYLEQSARYYASVPPGDAAAPESLATGATPDYNLDQLAGVEYELDLAQPAGSRVASLTLGGAPVADDQQFVVAVNNYRRSGGGGFPHVATAPVVYDEQAEIRQLLIDRAQGTGTIDPADFAVQNWWLTAGGQRLFG